MPLAFHTVRNLVNSQRTGKAANQSTEPVPYVFTGFQLKTSMFHLNLKKRSPVASMTNSVVVNQSKNLTGTPTSQLASLFFKIQVNLRHLTKSFYIDEVLIEDDEKSGSSLSLDLARGSSSDQGWVMSLKAIHKRLDQLHCQFKSVMQLLVNQTSWQCS